MSRYDDVIDLPRLQRYDGKMKDWVGGQVPEAMTASEATELASAVNAVRTVTYVANEPGATGTMDTDIVHVGDVYTVKPCAYQVEGMTFSGWSESPVATTAEIAVGVTLTIQDGVTLYAIWTASE